MDFITAGKEVFEKEIIALCKTKDALDESFTTLVDYCLHCRGKVVFTGIGKSGHIGAKLAATMASLGTPSFYLHPGEAMHGDLGMVDSKDVVFLLSYSGNSEEVVRLLPVMRDIGCKTIAITGNKKSALAEGCDYCFVLPAFEEACYLHLAPTSSTTALLALGDALAVTVSQAKNYTREDFGLIHPAGALGKKLSIHVKDLMHSGACNAVVSEGTKLQKAIIEMSAKGLSMVSVTDSNGKLMGIITDGDLRRMLERGVDVYNESIDAVMTRTPTTVDSREMAVQALQLMSNRNFTGLPVLDENGIVVGTLLMQDIIKAGIVK